MSSSGRGHVAGPLALYAEGFREDLFGQGYSWGSAAHQVHLMAHLSRWLEAQGLVSAALDECVTGQFLAARRADGYAALRSARAVTPLLGYLRGRGWCRRRGWPRRRRLLTGWPRGSGST